MDESLLAAYRASTYLVCIDPARWAAIHIGQPLPKALQTLVGDRDWGFVSAWNPQSKPRPLEDNTRAQAQLLATVHADPRTVAVRPGVGIGHTGWYEASLFVIGLPTDVLDAVCRAHDQCAYVFGRGCSPAALRPLSAADSGSVSHGQPPDHCGQSRQ